MIVFRVVGGLGGALEEITRRQVVGGQGKLPCRIGIGDRSSDTGSTQAGATSDIPRCAIHHRDTAVGVSDPGEVWRTTLTSTIVDVERRAAEALLIAGHCFIATGPAATT